MNEAAARLRPELRTWLDLNEHVFDLLGEDEAAWAKWGPQLDSLGPRIWRVGDAWTMRVRKADL